MNVSLAIRLPPSIDRSLPSDTLISRDQWLKGGDAALWGSIVLHIQGDAVNLGHQAAQGRAHPESRNWRATEYR